MTINFGVDDSGIAEVVIDAPPVNALTVGDVWAIRDAFVEISANEAARVVILRAEGKGFNGGADMKEMQSTSNFVYALGSGDACYAAFDQVYRTPVPVIAAVQGYCMGLGVGLVGSCDFVVAASNARFALPEVDRGALGCASHLAKLVPPMRLRQMTYLCRPVTAAELYSWGTIAELVEPEDLVATAHEYAKAIAEKRANVVRAAKMALNGIDTFDLADNYRFEQGFTYELNLRGDGDAARNAFVQSKANRKK